ncbi:trimeric intracellular cation channel family protein [Ectothiorhodospira lacustris]|uniref:trimeric intracellular cation channel family protein n=1 Tax=Ectothiorhodospira lacustris TaxID=2899127 RepID=UPI001EE786FA|nr:TRIC cation channel family protein [Ectothiorhodospira lacustris]MCG5510680.1 TRIC cation channel family protein [Ectothiorhodospira lacustris]MCG5522420.1 TRIC cation channel family protein [Ectothiorhodospira lacustris]
MTPESFALPAYFDLGAVFVFALSGVVVAMRKGYDLIGMFFLALVTGAGGGLLRDGLFLQQGLPVLLTDPGYLAAIGAATLIGLVFGERAWYTRRGVAIIDAAGIGGFAVVGIERSLEAGLGLPAALLVGVLNGVGGSLIRDVIAGDPPLILKPGQFYALAVLVGGTAYLAMTQWLSVPVVAAAWVTILITFALRMASIEFNWSTRAVHREGLVRYLKRRRP